MTSGNNTYYFHYDPLGSVVNLTNSTGTTMWTDSYEPYGLIHTETKNSAQAPTAVMKFAGEYLDRPASTTCVPANTTPQAGDSPPSTRCRTPPQTPT